MMEAMKKEYSISEMADALEVSASGYADHLKKEERPRKRQDREFGEKLEAIFEGSRKTYGLPRLQSALRDEGIGCGKKRIARLIFPRKRVEGLFGYSGLWFRGDSKSSGDL
jgi:putative transposase